jgi:uncharacterized membrane protein YgcG
MQMFLPALIIVLIIAITIVMIKNLVQPSQNANTGTSTDSFTGTQDSSIFFAQNNYADGSTNESASSNEADSSSGSWGSDSSYSASSDSGGSSDGGGASGDF